MKIKGVTEQQIAECAAKLGMEFRVTGRVGRYVQGVLRMATGLAGRPGKRPEGATKYRKLAYGRFAFGSGPEYAQGAVCFHGHRDFYRLIYGLNPEAVIRTKLGAYIGREGFERTFPPLADTNIGSQACPLRYGEACDCDPDEEHEVQFGTLLPSGQLVNVRHVKQAAISKCPFFILVADHYREDGTCKCDDPVERERMKREWDYTDESFRRAGITL